MRAKSLLLCEPFVEHELQLWSNCLTDLLSHHVSDVVSYLKRLLAVGLALALLFGVTAAYAIEHGRR